MTNRTDVCAISFFEGKMDYTGFYFLEKAKKKKMSISGKKPKYITNVNEAFIVTVTHGFFKCIKHCLSSKPQQRVLLCAFTL